MDGLLFLFAMAAVVIACFRAIQEETRQLSADQPDTNTRGRRRKEAAATAPLPPADNGKIERAGTSGPPSTVV